MSVSLVSWIGTFYNYALLLKYQTNFNYLTLILSIITIIFIMTVLAMIFGHYNAFYPTVRIHMDNLSIVKGKLIKYNETILLVVDSRLVRINRNKILFVEELD